MDSLYQNQKDLNRQTRPHTAENLEVWNSGYETDANGIRINTKPRHDENEETRQLLHYEIEDVPSWYLIVLLGIQNYLIMAGTTIIIPIALSDKLCLQKNDPRQSDIISTIIFASGIATILQSTFGTRLPIIQGGSFNFLYPTLAILSLEKWECKPDESPNQAWQIRMREIQGAIIVSSLFQVAIGFFGIIGFFVRFITPMTVAPSIIILGLSIFKTGGEFSAKNWPVAIVTIIFIIIISQYFGTIKVPIPFTSSLKREGTMRYPIFQVFPILITIIIMWIICWIMTLTEFLPVGNEARTDAKANILMNSPWFRVPYPFQWGTPTVTSSAVVGMLAGVISGMVESIGDYYACARIVGTKPPPVHSINRGIFVEGLGCIIAGIWGTGNGTTSYSENIGAISVTRVGSRRVIQFTGLIMMLCSLVTKIGGVFVSVPTPIVGGVLCVSFSLVTAVGISNLKSVNLNSMRNLFIVGFSTFFALTVSEWMGRNKGSINIPNMDGLNQIIEVMLSTGMFLAGLLGFILDNTIPGTLKDRGLLNWIERTENTEAPSEFETPEETYNLPFGMETLERKTWTSWLPISPTFNANNYYNLLPKWLNCGSHPEIVEMELL